MTSNCSGHTTGSKNRSRISIKKDKRRRSHVTYTVVDFSTEGGKTTRKEVEPVYMDAKPLSILCFTYWIGWSCTASSSPHQMQS